MNHLRHILVFLEKTANDRLLNPTHISLYMALFHSWSRNGFKNPVSISRDDLMTVAKIDAKATYHNALHVLDSLGYIKYEPTSTPHKYSQVHLLPIDPKK